MTPGQHVRARRDALGLSGPEVTARGGPSPATLSLIENDRWERGSSPRSNPTKLALAKVLEWPPPAWDWLQEGDEPDRWEREVHADRFVWTRHRLGEEPMQVVELRPFTVSGSYAKGTAVQPAQDVDVLGLMGLVEEARDLVERVDGLEARVAELETRLEGAGTSTVSPGVVKRAAQLIEQVDEAGKKLGLAAKGERDPGSEAETVTKIDQARKKRSPKQEV